MDNDDPRIPEALLERALLRLGFQTKPHADLVGLRALYAAWCERVPFDNVRKLIHLENGDAAALPGTEPEDFLNAWLRHGTGGTCWAGSGALCAVLQAAGFRAERGVATMLHAPQALPNHGTVRVFLENQPHLVDTSILFGEPMLLTDGHEVKSGNAAWSVTAAPRDGHWHIQWRPLHNPNGMECRLEYFGSPMDEHRRRYAETRAWSPFNYQLTARINRGREAIGAAFGNAVILRANGTVDSRPIDDSERRRILLEDFGMSEEIVAQLPADRPTPPPPGSKTAAQGGT